MARPSFTKRRLSSLTTIVLLVCIALLSLPSAVPPIRAEPSQAQARAEQSTPPELTADCSVSPYGAAALLALQDKIGYVDAEQGFRHQLLIAAAGGGGSDPGVLNALYQGQDLNEGRNQTTGLQLASARLGSSGRAQLVAAFRASPYSIQRPGEPNPTDEPARLQIATLDYANGLDQAPVLNRWVGSPPKSGFTPSGLAVGALSFGDATRDNVVMTTIESQELVSTNTEAFLYLFGGGDKNGAGAIGQEDNSWLLRRPLDSRRAVSAKAAIGELGGKGLGNDLVTAVLVDGSNGSPLIKLEAFTNKNQQLTALASTDVLSAANRIALAVGDIDGSGQESIVLAAHIGQDDARRITVSTWKLVPDPLITTTLVLSRTGDWQSTGISNEQIELAIGDLNADGLHEIIVADHINSSGDAQLRVTSLNAGERLSTRGIYLHPSTTDKQISLISSTFDQSGYYGVVVGFRARIGSDQSHVFYALADNADAQNALTGTGLRRVAALQDPITAGGPLAVGNFNGSDQLTARYLDQCRTVSEAHLNAVVFMPPHWAKLNSSGTSGRFGRGNSESNEQGTSVTTTKGGSVNTSIGVGFNASFDIFGPKIENKTIVHATYSRDWFTNATRTNSQGTTTVTTVGQSNDLDFVVFDQMDYTCYNYELERDGAPQDASSLTCQPSSPLLWSGRDIGTWTEQAGGPISKYQWMPAAREWANLALDGTASQSSTAGDAAAARAIDGRFEGELADGSVSSTNTENQPWWQVDLGSVQNIDTVSVWNRIDSCCYSDTLDFKVFISETPFTSNDPAVLENQSTVYSYAHSGQPGPVTHIVTRAANTSLRGRYLRVQLPGNGTLALAEVQVFGPAHREPDQLPIAVGDNDPDDGTFDVYMRDGTVRQVHGTLLWPVEGTSYNGGRPTPQAVSPGGNNMNWSMRQDKTTRQLTAEEKGENNSIGIQVETEFAIKPGPVVKATVGGRYSWGERQGSSTVRAYGSNFELSGTAAKLVSSAPAACGYIFQPYYYETSGMSSYGFTTSYRVVDYVVPALSGSGAALNACRQTVQTPTLESDVATGKAGSAFSLSAVGFPANSKATLAVKAPGASAYRDITQLDVDANGQLVFVLLTRSDDPLGTYDIRLSSSASATTQQASSAETSITLEAGGQLLPRPPGDAPDVSLGSSATLYLPLVRR